MQYKNGFDFKPKEENSEYIKNIKNNVITISISNFPRLSTETTDKERLDRAIEQIPEGTNLLLPNGSYNFGNEYVIQKRISIIGESKPTYNGTTLVGGTIIQSKLHLAASGMSILNLGILTTQDNGIEISEYPASDILISKLMIKAVSHGILIQSYNGTVENIIVEKTKIYGGIHGFISKAPKITFTECESFGCTTNGFAFISDNIQAYDKKGLCVDNKVVNCKAFNSQFGLNTYCRDMFSENNANSIAMKGLVIDGFLSSSCSYGYSFGDITLTPPTGNSYIECTDIRGVNLKEELSSTESFIVTRLTFSSFLNLNLTTKAITWRVDTWNREVFIQNNSSVENANAKTLIKAIGTGVTPTFDSIVQFFKTQQSVDKTLTNFVLQTTAQATEKLFYLMIEEDYTMILENTNLVLKRPYKGKGSWIVLKYYNSKWYEVMGWSAMTFTTTERNALTSSQVQIGMFAFDKTLNKPIWRNASNNGWIDGTGASI